MRWGRLTKDEALMRATRKMGDFTSRHGPFERIPSYVHEGLLAFRFQFNYERPHVLPSCRIVVVSRIFGWVWFARLR